MSTTAPQPATTPIPVQLSEPEFEAFLLPHLSMPKRGPKCKLGYYRVFNLILWVLYTGMQWKCLPVPHDPEGKPAIQGFQERVPDYGTCSIIRLMAHPWLCNIDISKYGNH